MRMRRKLASRLIGALLLLLAGGAALTSAHTIYTEKRLLRDQADRLGRSLAQATAAMSVEALLRRDYDALEHKVAALVHNGPGVVFARIERRDGFTVAEHPPRAAHEPAHPPRAAHEPAPHVIMHDIEVGAGSGRHALGRVVLGLSGAEASALLAQRSWALAGQSLVMVLALGGLLALLIRRAIGKPLDALATHAARIGEGRFDGAIDLGTGDELQHLAATLDGMRARLKAREEELRTLTASLSAQNERLADALTRSTEATRVKHEFMANVSHELRTPLNTIVNVPEVLVADFPRTTTCRACSAVFALAADEHVDEACACPDCGAPGALEPEARVRFVGDAAETARYLQAVNRAGLRLAAVIDDLMLLSQLTAGPVDLHLGPVPLGAFFADLCQRARSLCQRGDIEIVVPAIDEPVAVRADAAKLSRIFLTLIGNAIKFSPGGGRIEVSLAREHDAGSVRLCVRDHGIGVPAHLREAIFDSFRQADGGQTRRFGGTGLGLAIVKKLVELHGGDIWVESEEGRGSAFYLRLPAHGPAPAVAVDEPRAAGQDAFLAAERTIVVVDDHEDAIEATRLALRHLPYRVLGVADAREALEVIRQISPDLIILDLLMPRMSGIAILRRLRADDATRDVPVLVTSAYGSKKDAVLELGARWLGKPWTHEAVALHVETLIQRPGMAAHAEERAP